MVSLPSRSDFWGVELTAKKKEAIWDAEDEDDGTRDDPDIVHTLHIQRIVLGANASKEDHLVTITAQNFAGNDLTHPLCWLNRKSISESQCSMHMALSPPVTLNLAQGSGPVHVIGIWEQQLEEDTYSSEGDDDEMDGQTDALDSKPFKDIDIKQKKRPASSPPTKPAKVAKKDEKTSKLVVPQQKKRIAEQDSDDEDEDDEEDNENDEEEEEESDEEEDEESEEEPSPPPKKKPQTKAFTPKQKANTPKSIGDKAAKKPGKGATPPGPRSFEELKSLLAKSPQIPKKREKFNNFLQNNLKVADPDMKNKLWNFVNKH